MSAAACGTTKTQQATDSSMAAEQFKHQPPPAPPPVNVSRSTESGPSGSAGVGR